MSTVTVPHAHGLTNLALDLTRARVTARQGESLLWAASVGAYAVVTATALTVAAGTMMFWNRWKHPQGLLAEVLAQDPGFEIITASYFVLALVACALVIPSAITLTSGAAVLGARGRERRLATLRLIGLSSTDVTRMTLVDTTIQAVVGMLLGSLGYWFTRRAWTNLTMLGMPLTVEEMTIVWWLAGAVLIAVLLLGLLSSWRGLRQVRISPLGVARLSSRPALKWWRLVAFAAIMVVGGIVWNSFDISGGIGAVIATIAVLAFMIQSINIVGPWILQQLSRAFAQLPWATTTWAARRIETSPTATWQRVSGTALLSLIGGYMALMPISWSSDLEGAQATLAEAAAWDFTKGVVIVLGFGLLLTAVSVFISQASAVLERAEQSRAMHRMGAPTSYPLRVMWTETLAPFVTATILGLVMGLGLSYPMYRAAQDLGMGSDNNGLLVMVVVLVVGIGFTVAALAACHPLQHRILAIQERAND